MLFGMVLRDFQKPDPITITHSESVHLSHLVVATESVPYLKQSKHKHMYEKNIYVYVYRFLNTLQEAAGLIEFIHLNKIIMIQIIKKIYVGSSESYILPSRYYIFYHPCAYILTDI